MRWAQVGYAVAALCVLWFVSPFPRPQNSPHHTSQNRERSTGRALGDWPQRNVTPKLTLSSDGSSQLPSEVPQPIPPPPTLSSPPIPALPNLKSENQVLAQRDPQGVFVPVGKDSGVTASVQTTPFGEQASKNLQPPNPHPAPSTIAPTTKERKIPTPENITVAISTSGHDHCIAAAHNGTVVMVVKADEVLSLPSFGKLRTSLSSIGEEFRRVPRTLHRGNLQRSWGEVYADFEEQLGKIGIWAYRIESLLHNIDSDDLLLKNDTKYLRAPLWAPRLNYAAFREYSHHLAHASIGFFDSPFTTAFIVGFDGGSDDGPTCYHLADRRLNPPIRRLACEPTNLGSAFGFLQRSLEQVRGTAERCVARACVFGIGASLLMAYSPHGTPVRGFSMTLRTHGISCHPPWQSLAPQDLAASVQYWLQLTVNRMLVPYSKEIDGAQGIVITGGVAANIFANTAILRRWRKPVHVPPDPSDSGLSAGLLLLENYKNATGKPHQLSFLGPHLRDLHRLDEFTARYAARESNSRELAQLLFAGKVVAVMHGRREIGPVALGHRALLALPYVPGIRERVLRITHGPWYDLLPLAMPTWATQAFCRGGSLYSPYGLFSERLTPEAMRMVGNVSQPGGLVQILTLGPDDGDDLLHDLLLEVARRHPPMLIVVPLAVRGDISLNYIEDAVKWMLREDGPDGVFVEKKHLFLRS
eukprot:TRINITY_DN80256_c0_g1_i1.p1 TRINITY_DN80256_c0_g1~~TRINITY_DN80256_c0_g1_i1.p1  ORF type:complete len:700 (+),score=65.19 TRINITY_DN80256_c0_g1_i1:38-2137(+)